LLAGLRYDIVHTAFDNVFDITVAGFPAGFPESSQRTTNFHLSPRIGLVYEPIAETLAFYAAYSQSFEPPVGGPFANPTVLRPETGETVEGGVKLDLFEKRLSLVASAYHTLKQNVVTQDTNFFLTEVGEIRSQGIELSAVGNITESLSVIANYA